MLKVIGIASLIPSAAVILVGCWHVQEPLVTDAELDAGGGGDTDTGTDTSELGKVVWAVRAGGPAIDFGLDVATSRDGCGYVVGFFREESVFGPGEANETVLKSAGDMDIFIAKVDPDGALIWAKRAGGAEEDACENIAAFADGSVVTTGYVEGTAVFGPGEDNETVLNSGGRQNRFMAKYAEDGSLVWAKLIGIGVAYSLEGGLEALTDGGILLTGAFRSTTTFGQGETSETVLTSTGYEDMFVARYASDGTLMWVKSAGGENSQTGYAVEGLDDGSVLLSGITFDSTVFGAGEGDVDFGEGIAVFEDGAALMTGFCSVTVAFNAGKANEIILETDGLRDICIAKVNP